MDIVASENGAARRIGLDLRFIKSSAVFLLGFGLLILSGCSSSESFEVTLRNAAGITAEAPVFVAGVQVGEVTNIQIEGNHATVEFEIQSEHQIALHSDSCVTLQAPTGVVALAVHTGTGDALEGSAIPECSPMDLVREAFGVTMPDVQLDLDGEETGRQAGEFVRDLAEGLRQGIEEPTVPFASSR